MKQYWPRICTYCAYFCPDEGQMGECRFSPPETNARFPLVHNDDWCGKWRCGIDDDSGEVPFGDWHERFHRHATFELLKSTPRRDAAAAGIPPSEQVARQYHGRFRPVEEKDATDALGDKLLRRLRREPGGMMARSSLLKYMRMPASEFNNVIGDLVKSEQVEATAVRTEGRNAMLYGVKETCPPETGQ